MRLIPEYIKEVSIPIVGEKVEELYTVLLGDQKFCISDICPPVTDFSLPEWQVPFDADSDLNKEIRKVTIEDLTNDTGSGAFDKLAKAVKAILHDEYERGRITGADYAQTTAALIDSALANATQFVLQKDVVFWQAQKGLYDAWETKVNVELAKNQVSLVQMQQASQRIDFANGKLRLMVGLEEYSNAVANREIVIPKQNELVDAQINQVRAETEATSFNINNILPKQAAMVGAQTEQVKAETESTRFSIDNILPKQVEMTDAQIGQVSAETASIRFTTDRILPKQAILISEQGEAQRAQTSGHRSDGQKVVGVLGEQVNLYKQQIISYQRDAEVKAARLFSDAWITMKTIDEGTFEPDSYTNTNIDKALKRVMTENKFT